MSETNDRFTTTGGSRRRWPLTPARLWGAILLVETVWMISAQLGRSPWHAPKGWTVLVVVAVTLAAMLLVIFWFAVALALRRKFQFSLAGVLLAAVAVAIPCGWLVADIGRASRQRQIVEQARQMGCGVLYDFNFSAPAGEGGTTASIQLFSGPRPGTTRWHELLGDDFFHEVVGAFPRTDAALALLAELPTLRRLDLNDAQITDEGLKAMRRCPRLEWLDLRGARGFTDDGLVNLAGLAELQVLLLRHTGVSDAGLAHLAGLAQLRNLDLGMTNVTGQGLVHLARLVRLRQLTFWGNPIDDAGLAHLRGLRELETLELGSALVTDEGLEVLAGMPQLRSLNLRGAQLTDAGLRRLAGLRHLKLLDLFNTRITDAGLTVLAGLPELETLRLGETAITPAGIQRLQQALPQCKFE